MNDSDIKETALMDRKSLDDLKEKKVSLKKESIDLQKKGGAFLLKLCGPKTGEVVYIEKSVMIIGRDDKADIVDKQDLVSRKHAKIVSEGKDISITDLASTNGTLVNNEPIKTVSLKDGDEIQMGNLIMQFFQETLGYDTSEEAESNGEQEKPSEFYLMVFKECEAFFGENAKQFLDRQITAHLKKTPQTVDYPDIDEITRWIKISGSLYMDDDRAGDLVDRILAHGGE